MVNFLKVLQGVLAGAFGVQSQKQANTDFESKSFWPYVVVGIIFTGVFVLTILLIVQIVLS